MVALKPEQRKAIPPYAALRAFEAVGSCGGIRRAAAELSVDHAAITRQLQALERWTGMRLVERSAGSGGKLTEEGRLYHQKVAHALSLLAGATIDLMRDPNEHRLRLWCAPGLASEWLTGRIGAFASQNPGLEFELQPVEEAPDFETHEADAYLHYVIDGTASDQNSSLRSMEVARPQVLAVASPDYIAAAGGIREPADLLRSNLLHEANTDQWRRWFAEHGFHTDEKLTGPKFYQGHLTLAAARRGQGVALANALLVADDLANRSLITLGPWSPVYLGGYVLTARRDNWQSKTMTQFRRWLEKSVAIA